MKQNILIQQPLTLSQQIQQLLGRLRDPSVAGNVMSLLEKIFKENIYNQDFVKIYLSVLFEFKKSNLDLNLECELKLLCFLVSQYSDFLFKDRQVLKKFYSLLEKYGEKSEEKVALDLSQVYIEVYKQTLVNNSLEEKFDFYKQIHQNLLGGGNKAIQVSFSIVIERVVSYIWQVQDKEFAALISQLFIPYFLNNPPIDSIALYRILGSLIKIQGVGSNEVSLYIQRIIIKLLQKCLVQDSKNFSKVTECCEIFKLIATQYLAQNKEFMATYYEEVIQTLEELTTHRILLVQNSSKSALKEWKKLSLQILQNHKMKTTKNILNAEKDVDEFLEDKTQEKLFYKNIPSNNNKNNQQNILPNINSPKIIKSNNFLQAGTGQGGFKVQLEPLQNPYNPSKYKKQNWIGNLIQNGNEHLYNDKNLLNKFNKQNMPEEAIFNQENSVNSINFNDDYEKLPQNIFNQNFNQTQKSQQQMTQNQNKDQKNNNFQQQQQILINNSKSTIQNQCFTNQSRISDTVIDQGQIRQNVQQFQANNNLSSTQQTNFIQSGLKGKLETILGTESIVLEEKEKWSTQNQNQKDQASNENNFNTVFNQNEKLENLWCRVLLLEESGNLDLAVDDLLLNLDDIYLLRLLMRNPNYLQKLKKETASKLITKFIQVYQTKFLDHLYLAWTQDFLNNKIARGFVQQQKPQVFNVLENISQTNFDPSIQEFSSNLKERIKNELL